MDNTKHEIIESCREKTVDVGKHQSSGKEPVANSQAHANTENCMMCGSSLEYLEQAEELTCAYCGKQ